MRNACHRLREDRKVQGPDSDEIDIARGVGIARRERAENERTVDAGQVLDRGRDPAADSPGLRGDRFQFRMQRTGGIGSIVDLATRSDRYQHASLLEQPKLARDGRRGESGAPGYLPHVKRLVRGGEEQSDDGLAGLAQEGGSEGRPGYVSHGLTSVSIILTLSMPPWPPLFYLSKGSVPCDAYSRA